MLFMVVHRYIWCIQKILCLLLWVVMFFLVLKLGVIYVPTASVSVYKAAWSDYADKIVGYDF